MAQPRVKKSQFRLVAFIVAVALISPWGFATPSSRPVGCAPAPLAGGWKWQPVSRLQRGRLKVFLKHVAFGVNSTQYYVESEWGRHWRGTEPDILSMRKAAGNSTRASYVSFGPNHQYFYGIDDWRYWRIDDPDIFKIVKENAVKFVSFGPKGAVIVVLKSGAYYFRNLPTELQDCITGRARSGNEDHNRIASVSLGNNDAYFVTFEDGCWQYSGIPSSMHKYIQEQEIKKNYRNETFEQIAFSQDLEEWYLRTNKRWWYQSRKLRSLEDTYKK